MCDCKDIREKLSAFIDKELTPSEMVRIEGHLRRCPSCPEEESTLRRVTELLDDVPDQDPAPAFAFQTAHRAASWKRCAYVKEHLYGPGVSFMLSLLSLVFGIEYGTKMRLRQGYGYLSNFDDFPPESFSSIYIALIECEGR